MPVVTRCDQCGKQISMPPSQYNRSKRHYCSRRCHMQQLNAELNPGRMTPETRAKLREARSTGTGQDTYKKYYGRHEHKVVAEQILGRALLPGEVVHHIDGDKHNNDPKNLMIFSSQAEHARWHAFHKQRG